MPAVIIKVNSDNPEQSAIAEAVRILKKGGVIAYPTETFYGLGADALNGQAVKRVFLIKGRDFSNPLPVIIGEKRDLERYVEAIPAAARSLIERFWPGGLTLVFRASQEIPPDLTAGTGKIGIRLSSHPVAAHLAAAMGNPITATSANPSGAAECSSIQDVFRILGEKLDAVVDGGKTPGIAGSTIVDVTVAPPAVLREGIIPASLIRYTLERT